MIFSIADHFIKRPILTSVCTILITLLGIVAIPLLPIAQLPEIAPTQIDVTANYIGADAETVEKTVTTILEREINGVEGMQYMTSSSSSDGTSSIQVVFNPDRRKEQAQVDVQNKVAIAESQLPDAVQQIGVITETSSPSILMVYGVYAENGEYDDVFLSNYLDLFVVDVLRRVEGVGRVQIFGERKYAMRIWVDPNALASKGLTANDVANALQEQNIQIGAGAIGQEPAPSDQSYQFTVLARGRLETAQEFEDLVLSVGENGSLVRLRDVGRAELGAENYSSAVQILGRPGIGIGIYQLPDSNALDVAEAVNAQMAELSQNFPPGMQAILAFDTTQFVTSSLREVLITLIQAVVLVVLIIFIFLQDWRTTIIPSVAIPVALIGSMMFLLLFGFSINTLTLFGCILATGVVVDDAIIVVEAIATKIEQGLTPRQAAFDSMDELSSAVISTSLVLMAVFIPVAFFPGTTGRIYQQFALTIAFAITISTFNALTFSPSISALMLRPQRERHGFLGWFFRQFNRGFDAVTRGYKRVVDLTVQLKWVVTGVFIALLGLTVWMYQIVPTGFVPEEDQGYFIGIMQAPEGVSLQYTKDVLNQVDNMIQERPEVQTTFMISGFSFDGGGANRGLFFGSLQPWDERGTQGSVQAILGQLNQRFQSIEDAIVVVFNAPAVQGLGGIGGFEFQLQDRSGGQLSINDLLANTYEVIGAANQQPPLQGTVFSQFTANTPQLQLEINRDRIKALDVDFDEALSTLGTYLGSRYVNDFNFGQRSYRVYVQADSEFRDAPEDIEQIYVRSNTNQMIPLAELVTITPVTGPPTINHFNLFRSIKIQGQTLPGFSSGQGIQAMEAAYEQAALPSVGRGWMGTAREEIQSGGQAPIIFSLGLIVVFLVLAAQYESYIDPLIIMLTVPLAILGALSFLAARGLSLDVYAQVGLVMLIGLASKNAILIVEFANQARQEGYTIVKAAVSAAEQRFRPILMTAISSLVGFFPLVTATGAGSASRWSLGTAVFGGLLIATFLSLLVVPVIYIVINTLAETVFSRGDSGPPDASGRSEPDASGSVNESMELPGQPSSPRIQGDLSS